jgi:hypothetical protein
MVLQFALVVLVPLALGERLAWVALFRKRTLQFEKYHRYILRIHNSVHQLAPIGIESFDTFCVGIWSELRSSRLLGPIV